MWRKEGFTLIELMIVVAIIAIIAAIAIPNLLQSQKAANETMAIASLKSIHAAQATWRQTSMSGTGKQDFWTYDISGLYRMLKGTTISEYVKLDVAKSDYAWHSDDSIAAGVTADWTPISTTLGAKAGYFLQAMTVEIDGTAYSENVYYNTAVAVANDYNFACMAMPKSYGSSGDRSFIMNQSGGVFAADTGQSAGAGKWDTTGGTELKWQYADPTDATNWPPVTDQKPWTTVGG